MSKIALAQDADQLAVLKNGRVVNAVLLHECSHSFQIIVLDQISVPLFDHVPQLRIEHLEHS